MKIFINPIWVVARSRNQPVEETVADMLNKQEKPVKKKIQIEPGDKL